VFFSSAWELVQFIINASFFLAIPALTNPLNSLMAGFKSSKLGLTG